METTHRKIELQSPLDLTYLHSNATHAAREKIDLHFPPSAAPESTDDDVMKTRVEELVNEYLERVFLGVKGNLNINGLEGEEMEKELEGVKSGGEELEPYDTKLASKLLKLNSNIEALTLQLANLRRTAPAQAAQSYAAKLQAQDEAFNSARLLAEERKIDEVRNVELDTQCVDWEGCERNWEGALGSLGELKERVGTTGARLERARGVVGYLDGEGEK